MVMTILTKMLKQTAVYWAPGAGGFDDFGRPILATPVEVDCRWVDTTEEFIDPQGVRQIARSKVRVGTDVVVGGMIMLGDLTDVADPSFPANPAESSDVFEIRSFSKVPDFKATKFLRVVYV